MATTPIESGSPGLAAAELIRTLALDLAKDLTSSQPSGIRPAAAESFQGVQGTTKPVDLSSALSPPIADVASVLLSEIATSDLTKLTAILEFTPDSQNSQVLDSLLRNAVQEVANGNAERAVGYLADYATRDPSRAAALAFEPALEPVRDKIDSMVSRMTVVAKMSAENGLSRAEQSASATAGQLSNWETPGDVLLKLAYQFFEAGGYANYSRTADLARVVTDAATEIEPVAQALAASASGFHAHAVPIDQPANQMLPGINIPYWTSSDFPVLGTSEDRRVKPVSRREPANAREDFVQNLSDLKEISSAAFRQLWRRAPLLVMMLNWLGLGLAGGLVFFVADHIWPESAFVAIGNLAFEVWGIGFLALAGFGFYARVRTRPLR